MSREEDLEDAIKDATHRALEGVWGAVDFALVFAANYRRPKKVPSPHAQAVYLLQAVLGKDIPIVSCCGSGVMGVGLTGSQPQEVDPCCNEPMYKYTYSNWWRPGEPEPPRQGVTILLGKLPAGWVARIFAADDVSSSHEQIKEVPRPAGNRKRASLEGGTKSWEWPEFSNALALTSSQAAELSGQLKSSHPGGVGTTSSSNSSGHTSRTLALQPEMCLLLFSAALQDSDGLGVVLEWLQHRAPAMPVVGGVPQENGKELEVWISHGAANRSGRQQAAVATAARSRQLQKHGALVMTGNGPGPGC
eukprot:gene10507-10667_t